MYRKYEYSSALRICKTLIKNGFKNRVMLVDNGDDKDPSDIFQNKGPKGIIKCLREAAPVDEFLLNFV